MVYEVPDTLQRLDPILSALSDSPEENLFPGIFCPAELCNATLYMMVAQHRFHSLLSMPFIAFFHTSSVGVHLGMYRTLRVYNNNQSSFGRRWILTILLMLGLVGFVGLVILHKTHRLGGAMLFAVSVLITLCAIGNSFHQPGCFSQVS
jgi:hypothetical protein